MRINGQWVGWGLGDNSLADMTVKNVKAFMRVWYRSYAGNLADTNLFDQQMVDAVTEMQRRLTLSGRLVSGRYIPGVLDLPTQIAMGFKAPPPTVKPIIFTVEGHLSDMMVGPCAFTAQPLEAQGVCHWQPVGYNSGALPFDNNSGIDELVRLVGSQRLGPNDSWAFPPGTPWGLIIFSQGGIIGSEFLLRHVLPNNGVLNWRLKDFKRSLAFGNPYREANQCASWVPDPPKPNTRGISDVRLDATKIPALAPIHREVARHGDLYTENEISDAGEMKTAIYKIVQGQWWGGSDSIFEQLMELFGPRGFLEAAAVFEAIVSGAMFLGNMGPHGMYDLGPGIEWMRGVRA